MECFRPVSPHQPHPVAEQLRRSFSSSSPPRRRLSQLTQTLCSRLEELGQGN